MVPVALDVAGETATLGGPGHVDRLDFGQQRHVDRVAQLVLVTLIDPELDHGPQRVGAGLAEMALHGHGVFLGFLAPKPIWTAL